MKLLLIGHGRMGQLVETLAADEGFEVVGAVTGSNAAADWPAADVAIDFSVAAAVPATVTRLARQRMPIVIGTTGWQVMKKPSAPSSKPPGSASSRPRTSRLA